MCLNCGCGEPDERHGDSANITRADVQHAADANGQTLEETAANLAAAAGRLGRANEDADA